MVHVRLVRTLDGEKVRGYSKVRLSLHVKLVLSSFALPMDRQYGRPHQTTSPEKGRVSQLLVLGTEYESGFASSPIRLPASRRREC